MKSLAISGVAALLLLVAGTATAETSKVTEVTIYKFQFDPREVTIPVGGKVRWVNREKRQYHSVWFEKLGEPEPDYLFPGDVYERTFDKAGDFPYRCGPHPEMTGIVHVR
ncbi:MAG TPA: plastocyanin [Chromatiales bacterium]|nr:plastocyanin [Chromatiales bacterium]